MVSDNVFTITFHLNILKACLAIFLSGCVLILLKLRVATRENQISVILKGMGSEDENYMSLFWGFFETDP